VSSDDISLVWRKSTRCSTTSCVEVASLENGFAVRDSKNPDGPALTFDAPGWATFVQGIRRGAFQAN
jgi:hypothetical protein